MRRQGGWFVPACRLSDIGQLIQSEVHKRFVHQGIRVQESLAAILGSRSKSRPNRPLVQALTAR